MIESFQLTLKNWESNFFSKSIHSLEVSDHFNQFNELKGYLEDLDFDIVEFNLRAQNIKQCYEFEEMGFRLVDSRMIFITKFIKKEADYSNQVLSKDLSIRFYRDRDFDQVIELSDQYLASSSTFQSRYQNTHYFGNEDATNYFRAWIKHSVKDPKSLISIIENKQGKVVGYFIYKNNGEHKDLAIYKGILCTVNENYRGQKLHLVLQDFLFRNFPEQNFYIDNTTQISNLPIVKNHIRVGRRLQEIYLTFLLKKGDLKI